MSASTKALSSLFCCLLVSQGLVERKHRPAASAPPLYQITPEGARLLDATGGAERQWDEES